MAHFLGGTAWLASLLLLWGSTGCRSGYVELVDRDAGDADIDSDTDSDTDSGPDCVPTEAPPETICDMIDNDCNGLVDDVDLGGDGFCDCLGIGILGSPGNHADASVEDRLGARGASATRILLEGSPGVVTDELLASFNVLIIDKLERELDPDETAALERFILEAGGGMITLIGYSGASDSPVPERNRANSTLTPFGLAYRGDFIHTSGIIPTFDDSHPVSAGISDVNFNGGIEPSDVAGLGQTDVFATVPGSQAGLAHQTPGGGRIIMWGDEWITFNSDWTGYVDVEQLWSQMLAWVTPLDQCRVLQN